MPSNKLAQTKGDIVGTIKQAIAQAKGDIVYAIKQATGSSCTMINCP